MGNNTWEKLTHHQKLFVYMLGQTIEEEISRPIDEINLEVIDFCEQILDKLLPVPPLTEEEIKKRVEEISRKVDERIKAKERADA